MVHTIRYPQASVVVVVIENVRYPQAVGVRRNRQNKVFCRYGVVRSITIKSRNTMNSIDIIRYPRTVVV